MSRGLLLWSNWVRRGHGRRRVWSAGATFDGSDMGRMRWGCSETPQDAHLAACLFSANDSDTTAHAQRGDLKELPAGTFDDPVQQMVDANERTREQQQQP